ncbi:MULTISPECIES: acyl--CoA ligase [unclassified Marinovum]
MITTLTELLAPHPDAAPAIGAPDRAWMSYGALRKLSTDVAAQLRAAGIGAQDRVAIVLPNGAAMASAFVTVAQAATTAPLNPSYREEEYTFYLNDLSAKAIILEAGFDGPAHAAARRAGLTILWLHADPETAGGFRLEPSAAAAPAPEAQTQAEDVALILHTSGTTSRPKIVPLMHSNVTASAQNIARSLALSPKDRCMNVMPLFHIHGLIAAVSATLVAGGSIFCTPGFNALSFFALLEDSRPTWYTAVPTMHQAILSRAGRNAETIRRVPLRFLRSSSASLPAQVMAQLHDTFQAPVIEAYGMTEAAHQMCCNRLDLQKPGSVGVAAGPEVRIAHETENRLMEGTGEVVISGPNVTPGYEGNPEANAKTFFEAEGRRWFRTGDQGALDGEGFLSLTGRLKEIINRGGEKVSPLEVDGVLMDHPDVAQVVTFALPHPKLGEEVATAVVLKDGAGTDEAGIRAFAAGRMADFKVPRKVVILDEIPKGATGKMQRIGMAEKLGLTEPA